MVMGRFSGFDVEAVMGMRTKMMIGKSSRVIGGALDRRPAKAQLVASEAGRPGALAGFLGRVGQGAALKVLTFTVILLTVGSMAYADNRQPLAHWVNQEPATVNMTIPQGLAGVMVLRTAAAGLPGPAVNVFVEGEYLTSLEPGGGKSIMICPYQQRLTVAYTDPSTRYVEKQTQGERYNLAVGEMNYFQVVAGANGKPVLSPLAAGQAQELLSRMQEQTHTMPRVDRVGTCAPVLKSYTLQANALFAFDKSDLANMLPKGREEVAGIGQEIGRLGGEVSGLEVIGHADPDGSAAYNQSLSDKRAQTVAGLLARSGIPSEKIRASGRGDRELVVSDCRAQHPRNRQARADCNQPNRRVDVVVYGSTQQQ